MHLVLISKDFFPAELPSSSVDFVIAFQSFHWFATPGALAEINRVLVPGGRFGVAFFMPDLSEEWIKDISSYISDLYVQESVPTPLDDDWQTALLKSDWFTEHAEDEGFRLVYDSSVEREYRMFASLSLIASGNEQVKAAFKEKFDQVIRVHFTDKGRKLNQMHHTMPIWCCTTNKSYSE